MFCFGLEKLLQDKNLKAQIKKKKIAYCSHPSSVDQSLNHGLDLLIKEDFNLTCVFSPQHGFRGDKQDNMQESESYTHPKYKIPVYSLYGKFRYPTKQMMDEFDVLLFDLQDIGTRVYTYLTTLFYMIKACHDYKKSFWLLDRPNPAGRPIEGFLLDLNYKSFVGEAQTPMRHGMTLGELSLWYEDTHSLSMDLKVVTMDDYHPYEQSWPRLCWINPSPNIPRFSSTQVYPGSVLIEGTSLSEGRGTTRPLEVFGAPFIDPEELLKKMTSLQKDWMGKAFCRPVHFEPTFHKFKHQLCKGLQVHVDYPAYEQALFQAFRFVSLFLKSTKVLYPQVSLWAKAPYEYENEKVPIDIISGDDFLRNWVDDPKSKISELELKLQKDEKSWEKIRKNYLLYEAK